MPDEVKLEPCPELIERVARAKALIDFLRGEAVWDGCWFGDDTRPAFHGPFWWRKDLPLITSLLEQLLAIEATRPTAATDDVVKELVEALPSDWPFWLDDAASILRSNGTTGHADKVRDVLIALTDALAKARTGVTLNG